MVMGDVQRWPQWCPTIRSVELQAPGRMELGASARVEQPGVRTAVWRVCEWNPPVSFAWETRHPGVHIVGDHRVRVVGKGVEVELSLAFSGWLAAMMAPVFRRQALSYMQREILALQRVCES